MEYYVVYLKCKRYIALPKDWIENPVIGQRSKVFFSGNASSTPDFTCEEKFYPDEKVNACYEAIVYKSFHTYETAKNFTLDKRVVAPVNYRTFEKFEFNTVAQPVDFIEISDSDNSLNDSTVRINDFEEKKRNDFRLIGFQV